MPDHRPLIEAPLETALGTFGLTALRDRSINVATGPGQTVTVKGAALTINAQFSRSEDEGWKLLALFAEPPDHDGAPAREATAAQHAALRRVLVPAVQAWARVNPHALWYAEWLHARDQHHRHARQLREYLAAAEDIARAVTAARQQLAATEALLARHLESPPINSATAIPQE